MLGRSARFIRMGFFECVAIQPTGRTEYTRMSSLRYTPALMTIQEAFRDGHRRIRKPNWAMIDDYVLLDFIDGADGQRYLGPWGHLYSVLQLDPAMSVKLDHPQDFPLFTDRSTDWVPYTGQPFPTEKQWPITITTKP